LLADFLKKFSISREIGTALIRVIRESIFVTYLATSTFLLLSLATFSLEDTGWSHEGSGIPIRNAAGASGAWLSDFFLSLFGVTAFLFPFILGIYGYLILRRDPDFHDNSLDRLVRWGGFILSLIAATGICDRFMVRPKLSLPEGYGGIIGQSVSEFSYAALGNSGMTVILVALLLVGISLFTGISWLNALDAAGNLGIRFLHFIESIGFRIEAMEFRLPFDRAMEDEPESTADTKPLTSGVAAKVKAPSSTASPGAPSNPEPRKVAIVSQRAEYEDGEAFDPNPLDLFEEPARGPISIPPKKAAAKTPAALETVHAGQLPSLDLLNSRAARVRGYSNTQLEAMSRQLEAILDDFGVEVQVMEVHPGPVITRFEVQPAAGVKVSRISGLAKDLARTLSVTSVRVVEIIPGKTVIGLEIPNEERETVLLHSILASDVYQSSASPLTLTLGKDISGNPVVANLARMPHLLVAGTTGSGKSVAVNVMILSMLFKAKPKDVRLIMIDPKMLELSIYEGIPHLLTPVVTDMREAANALRWCVAEMERRYKLMSVMGVRNIAGFNEKVQEAIDAGTPIKDPLWAPDLFSENEVAPDLTPLPFIVIVIDELADMMMIVGKKVEELIARLAQKARAAGLHLILATQRPSVDVITGLIKANIPTRIAFQVSSKIDSRTILDQGGAESLLGNGDMLYLPPGTGLPMRAHGAFVSDDEVHHIVEFLKRTGPTDYILDLTRFSEDSGDFSGYKGGNSSGDGGEESDALYDEAVRFVTESRKASISSVQRRFKIGYNRAARMIEDMEMAGIVGAAETNGSRVVIAPPPPSD
jgi:S-DNA-T family DNA segregation ATPase FtsK/SpoIIIE